MFEATDRTPDDPIVNGVEYVFNIQLRTGSTEEN